MKKNILLLILSFAAASAASAQDINVDSIVSALIAKNPVRKVSLTVNNDSLYNLLPATTHGPARVKLIYNIYTGHYKSCKDNVEMGYRVLTWARTNHDLISEAVISAELGQTMFSNGDRSTATQLETAAMAAAKKSGDPQALGIVYQDAPVRLDVTEQQIKSYALTGIKFSEVAKDTQRIGWGYFNLSGYYSVVKPDSQKYFTIKALKAFVLANSLPEVCQSISVLGLLYKDERRERYMRSAYLLARATGNAAAINFTAEILSANYFEKNKADSALIIAYQSLQASRYLAVGLKAVPANTIAKIYFKKRNIDSAVKYYKLYYELHEQLYNNKSQVWVQAIMFAEIEKQQQQTVLETALKNTRQREILAIAIVFLLLLAIIFWRNYRLSRRANKLLAWQKKETEFAMQKLNETQAQLIHSEKMASLGELTAGIAHEIQNPLNFVNNFSEVSIELLEELQEEAKAGNIEDVVAIAFDLSQNLEKMNHHGKRADSIVKGMLEHSRASSGRKEPTDLNKLADEYLRLAYHGIRVKDSSFDAALVTNFDDELPLINIIPQDIGRVLLNLFNNAFYATQQKKKNSGPAYKPIVKISTSLKNEVIKMVITDNGIGIPDAIKDKIMQPFFTTKPSGEGTGLGLSLSYDIIVKVYGGSISMNSSNGEGSEFIIQLPLS